MQAVDAASERRPSGIDLLGHVPWGSEWCQLYRTSAELAEVLVPFFAAGLAGNERCLWLTGEAIDAAAARALLREHVANYARSERAGQIQVIDPRDWDIPGRAGGWDELSEQWLTLESLALGDGYAGLRVGTDLGWLAEQAASQDPASIGSAGPALKGRRILAISAYPLARLSAADLLGALRRHGTCLLRQGERWEAIESATALLAEVAPRERSREHSPSTLRLRDPSARDRAASEPAEELCRAPEGLDLQSLWLQHEQCERALTSELERGRALESERDLLLAAERRAAEDAAIAQRHLTRLQGVTSALSEALSIADVRRVLSTAMADAVGARAAAVALAGDAGSLSVIPDTATALGSQPPPRATAHPVSSAGLGLLQVVYDTRLARWPAHGSGAVALPLSCGAARVGAVVFELEPARELLPAERALFEDLARQLALALDRARMYELARLECARAEEASRAKDEFLALLGHELRNPLSPMLTALELMRIRAGDVALKERSIIERQMKHMLRLVDDLLDVSRITRGALPLSRSHVTLSEVVDRAIEMAEPMIDERMHRLHVSLPAEHVWLDADAHRLSQALANLLLNAAKYTPSGGSLKLTGVVADDKLRISVHDNGVGMDRSLLFRVFEPFVQRPQPLDRASGGLGLGLTIARRVVELHGGTVSADSEGLGLGSTFKIELDVVPSKQGAGPYPTPVAPSHARPRTARHAGSVSVLVVDDNVDAADMLAEALRARGAQVRVAHDGPEALALVDDFRPQLALLDIGLPVMDGCDLAQRLKARLSDAPPMFVAVTGYGQPSDRARTKQAGFSEHLVKPVDMARITALIKNLEECAS
jgi:signal transduction histidine kinase/CheY-like chemotaxis protein